MEKSFRKASFQKGPWLEPKMKDNINPIEIIAYLESLYNQRILPHETLVILDEIQDW